MGSSTGESSRAWWLGVAPSAACRESALAPLLCRGRLYLLTTALPSAYLGGTTPTRGDIALAGATGGLAVEQAPEAGTATDAGATGGGCSSAG